jgi:tetratricopeptide (TPR) repeat protein
MLVAGQPTKRRTGRVCALALGAVASVTCAASWTPEASAALERSRHDADDLARMRAEHPDAARALEEGEAASIAGRADEAARALARATAIAPESSLAARRQCEALAALGRRGEAVAACRRALDLAGGITSGTTAPMILRATARAWLSDPGVPATDSVAQALAAARDATQAAPSEPWGYAAQCDVAQRIGDDVMLQKCLSDLERVAPAHSETAAARAAARALTPRWPVGVAWIALALASLGTAVHAAVRRLGGKDRRALAGAAAFVATLTALAHPAYAEPPPGAKLPKYVSSWPIDDKDPEKSIPSEADRQKNPLEMGYWMMDLIARGQDSSKAGDHAGAIRYFKALSKVVPENSVPFMKLCGEYRAIDDWSDAAESCAMGLKRAGATADDEAQFINVMISKPTRWTDAEMRSVITVFTRLRADKRAHDVDAVECAIGVKAQDTSLLQECVPQLVARAPAEQITLMSQWALAMKTGDHAAALAVIEHAKQLKMPPETLARLEQQLNGAPMRPWLWLLLALFVSVAACAAGVLLRDRWKLPTDPPGIPKAATPPAPVPPAGA